MMHPRGRAFNGWDFAILAASVILGVCLVAVNDREYMMIYGVQPSRVSQATRLPDWIKERKGEAIRLVHGGTALLAAFGLGLAVVVLRPRGFTRHSVAYGPGAIAAILTATLFLVFAIRWELLTAIEPPSPPGLNPPDPSTFPLGFYLGSYAFWTQLRPHVTWLILGAWITLFAAGRWRRPVDGADHMGRWLGAGWLVLGLGQAAIYVIAWY